MSGIYDNVAVIGDWVPPSPSTRAFFSSFLNDDISSKNAPEHPGENNTGDFFMRSRELVTAGSSEKMDMPQASPQLTDLSSFSEQKSSSRGGLVERIAARAGFNAPRLNTEGIRCADLSFNPDIQSPYLTIPPGLSPTTLLDSPVFVSNSLAQPSPTTGKFSFMISGNNRNSTCVPESNDKDRQIIFDDVNTSSFAFKPVAESGSSFFMSASSKMKAGTGSQQCFPSVEGSVQSENTFQSLGVEPTKFQSQRGSPLHYPADVSRSTVKKDESATITTDKRVFDSLGSNAEHPSAMDEQQDEEGDQRVSGDSTVGASAGATPSEDGYNWRKYGQKQVKGSEYPRSYYKCTHPNCPVKKKVERSHEGHITEIIYKSAHNHPKPPPSRRSTLGSSNQLADMQLDASEHPIPQSGTGNDSVWASTQRGTAAGTPEWRIDNVEVTSSASGGPEFGNPSLSVHAQNGNNFESGDAVDVSSTFSNDDDEDDRATHGSIGYEGEGEESDSKRRKLETYAAEMSGATRAIREPRVVVQTTSEVDILDDGYRWRKYGQKVVKGNPNPRSYYKCTNAGCTVRKHVERASHDLKSVITTYEGKHNHDVPAARNSSHVNSGSSGGVHSQAAAAAAVPAHVHRPETSQVHNSMTRFDRSAAAAYGSFSLPGRQQLRPPPNFSFGMNQAGLANLTMAGIGSGHHPKMPLMQVHPYLMQQRPVNEMGYVLPKGEPKVEPPLSESSLNMSNNPTVYQQIMSRLPLGPHR